MGSMGTTHERWFRYFKRWRKNTDKNLYSLLLTCEINFASINYTRAARYILL